MKCTFKTPDMSADERQRAFESMQFSSFDPNFFKILANCANTVHLIDLTEGLMPSDDTSALETQLTPTDKLEQAVQGGGCVGDGDARVLAEGR